MEGVISLSLTPIDMAGIGQSEVKTTCALQRRNMGRAVGLCCCVQATDSWKFHTRASAAAEEKMLENCLWAVLLCLVEDLRYCEIMFTRYRVLQKVWLRIKLFYRNYRTVNQISLQERKGRHKNKLTKQTHTEKTEEISHHVHDQIVPFFARLNFRGFIPKFWIFCLFSRIFPKYSRIKCSSPFPLVKSCFHY